MKSHVIVSNRAALTPAVMEAIVQGGHDLIRDWQLLPMRRRLFGRRA